MCIENDNNICVLKMEVIKVGLCNITFTYDKILTYFYPKKS